MSLFVFDLHLLTHLCINRFKSVFRSIVIGLQMDCGLIYVINPSPFYDEISRLDQKVPGNRKERQNMVRLLLCKH
jgi:hypothetical protein